MNRSFRTLYNESLGAWVAVPETARARGKGKGTKSACQKIRAVISCALAALVISYALPARGDEIINITYDGSADARAQLNGGRIWGPVFNITFTGANLAGHFETIFTTYKANLQSLGATATIQNATSSLSIGYGWAGSSYYLNQNYNGSTGTFNNNGLLHLTYYDGAWGKGGGAFYNTALFNNNAGATVQVDYIFENSGTLNNAGTITNYRTFSNSIGEATLTGVGITVESGMVGSGTLNNSGTINNDGTTRGNLAQMSLEGVTTNTGTINNKNGAFLAFSDTVNNSGTITNSGSSGSVASYMANESTLNILSGGSLVNGAEFSNRNVVNVMAGGSVTSNGTFTNDEYDNAVVNNSGTFTSGGIFENKARAIVNNYGTFNANGFFYNIYDTTAIPAVRTTINNYGTLNVGGWLINDATLNNAGTINVALGGALSMTSNATYSGNGTIAVSGTLQNESSNSISINNLTLNGGQLQHVGSGVLYINTLQVDSGHTGHVTNDSRAIHLNTAYVNGLLNITTEITGSGSLTKTGSGLLGLGGDNTYTGGTNLYGGIVQVGSDANLGNASGALRFDGGSLRITNDFTSNRAVTLYSGDGVIDTYTHNLTLTGNITGSGELAKVGDGVLTLTGTNTYSGGTSISAGTLQGNSASVQGDILNNAAVVFAQTTDGTYAGAMSGSGSLTKTSAGTLILSGTNSYMGGTTVSAGTLQGNSASLQGNILNNAAVIFNQTTDGLYSGVMSGTGTLTKTGSSTLALSGNNTYIGNTTINAGTLQIGSDANLGNVVSSVIFNGGSLQTINSFTSNRGMTLNAGGGTVDTTNQTLTLAGTISGAGEMTKTGSGVLVLNANNTYIGGTTINAGTVQIGSNTNLGNVAGGVTFDGGTLQATNSFTSNRSITLNAGGGTVDTTDKSLTLTGTLSGTGDLTKTGSGMLTLSASNIYTGDTTVNGGTLRISSDANLGNVTGSVNLNGGTLQVSNSFTSNRNIALGAGAGTVDTSNETLTLTGTLSGTGVLIKDGTGTLILSGANTYSGGTINLTGTLEGNSGSLQGEILNNALVVFNQTTDGTYGGRLFGAGSLTKTGAGTLTLSGDSGYDGTTSINDGALSVNGTLSSNVVVASGGTLMGNGNIVGNVTNGGKLAPGNSIGTTTIIGNYTQSAGSVYEVEANAAGQSDLLIVTGTATLNGGTVAVLAENGVYNMSTLYTILAAGNVVGTYADVTSNLAFLTPTLIYTADGVILQLNRNGTDFSDTALTRNQRAVAESLDRISPSATGDMSTVLNSVLSLSASGARHAYDQMGGLVHTALIEENLQSSNRYLSLLNRRMNNLSSGTSSVSQPLVSQKLSLCSETMSNLGDALMMAADAAKQKDSVRHGFWATAFGVIGDRNGTDIASRYGFHQTGFAAGFDGSVSDRVTLGASVSYAATKVSMDDLSDTGNIDSYQTAVYGTWNAAPWYTNMIAAYTFNHNDTSRQISFGGIDRRAKTSYSGHTLAASVETGYRLQFESLQTIPFVSLQGSRTHNSAFHEDGAKAINLDGDNSHATSFAGAIGIRLRSDIETASGKISPELRLRRQHEFRNDGYALNASFSGTPASAFVVRSDDVPRNTTTVGFGLGWQAKKNVRLEAALDASFAEDRREQSAGVELRYTW